MRAQSTIMYKHILHRFSSHVVCLIGLSGCGDNTFAKATTKNKNMKNYFRFVQFACVWMNRLDRKQTQIIVSVDCFFFFFNWWLLAVFLQRIFRISPAHSCEACPRWALFQSESHQHDPSISFIYECSTKTPQTRMCKVKYWIAFNSETSRKTNSVKTRKSKRRF